jgi:hypothetical protein
LICRACLYQRRAQKQQVSLRPLVRLIATLVLASASLGVAKAQIVTYPILPCQVPACRTSPRRCRHLRRRRSSKDRRHKASHRARRLRFSKAPQLCGFDRARRAQGRVEGVSPYSRDRARTPEKPNAHEPFNASLAFLLRRPALRHQPSAIGTVHT